MTNTSFVSQFRLIHAWYVRIIAISNPVCNDTRMVRRTGSRGADKLAEPSVLVHAFGSSLSLAPFLIVGQGLPFCLFQSVLE